MLWSARSVWFEPEFALMSRRPGLGTTWFEKFASDAFPSDFLIVDGRKVRPPGFYLRKLDEAAQQPIKRSRKRFGSAGATCEQQQGAPGCARRDLQFAPEASGQDAVICVWLPEVTFIDRFWGRFSLHGVSRPAEPVGPFSCLEGGSYPPASVFCALGRFSGLQLIVERRAGVQVPSC